MKIDEIQDRFSTIFAGNTRSYGVYTAGGKYTTISKKPTIGIYGDHLKGITKVSIVPSLESGKCWHAALDFDNHNQVDGVKLVELSKAITEKGLPMVICRSKSGGAHGYIFGAEPLDATLAKKALKKIASQLMTFGSVDIEIFPKQVHLEDTQKGNHLSLPYFGNEKTREYALVDGHILNIISFLKYVDTIKITNSALSKLGSSMDSQAPPCIQELLSVKLEQGSRNNALYNYGVYAKKAYGDDWEAHVHDFNTNNFAIPLQHVEVKQLLSSVSKNKYKYKCKEEPCASRCNSKICVTREYGISQTEKKVMELADLPKIKNLKKYLTDPIKWEVTVNNVPIYISTDQLLEFRLFRKVLFEMLNMVVSNMSKPAWEVIIDDLSKNIEVIEVPEDATRDGMIRTFLYEFTKKAENNGLIGEEAKAERQRLLQGKPIMQHVKNVKCPEGRLCFIFRGPDFTTFLQTKKMGLLTPSVVWMALRGAGGYDTTIRLGNKNKDVIKVWAVPMNTSNSGIEIDELPIHSEF